MAKYKVGDIVKVRNDLVTGKWYGNESVSAFMCLKAGQTVKIKELIGFNSYIVEEDPYLWNDDMFECLAETSAPEFTKSDLKDGMIIEYNDGDRGMVVNGTIMGKYHYVDLSALNASLEHCTDDYCTVKKVYKTTAKTLKDCFRDDYLELIWERKSEYYNGKVVCLDNNFVSYYTKGKIYEFKDGVLISDSGAVNPAKPVRSIEEFAEVSNAKWFEIVE